MFSSDRPINSSGEDLLGRGQFARSLSKAITTWREESSLVIALSGPWGDGKTSLKNLVLSELQEQSSAIQVVQFNPWRWAAQDQLFEAFFSEIERAILCAEKDKAGTSRSEIAKKWVRYAGVLRKTEASLRAGSVIAEGLQSFAIALSIFAAILLPAASSKTFLFVILALVLIRLGMIGPPKILRGTIELITVWRLGKFRPGLEGLRDELTKSLASVKDPILVVVDDIDRLTGDQARQVVQLIKANADFPNLIYLMLYQRDVLEGLLSGPRTSDGKGYLDKIVQVHFDLPKPDQEVLDKYFATKIKELFDRFINVEDDFTEHSHWASIYQEYLQGCLTNLRRVNRLMSSLSFNVGLVSSGSYLEVNAADLVALECLRLFDPKVYGALPGHRAELLGHRKEGAKERLDSLLEVSVDAIRTGNALCELFPNCTGLDTFQKSDEHLEKFRRVASREHFDRYFHLGLAEHEIPEEFIQTLVRSIVSLTETDVFLRTVQESRWPPAAVLQRLRPHLSGVDAKRKGAIMENLFRLSNCYDPAEIDGELLKPQLFRNLAEICEGCLEEGTDEAKAERICETAKAVGALYLTSLLALRADVGQSHLFVSSDQPSLIGYCCDQFSALGPDLLDQPGAGALLNWWARWRPIEGVREAIQNRLESDKAGAVKLLRVLLAPGVDEVGSFLRIQRSSVDEFSSVPAINAALESVSEKELAGLDATAVSAFRQLADESKAFGQVRA